MINIVKEILLSQDYSFNLSVALDKKIVSNGTKEHVLCAACVNKPCLSFSSKEEVCENSLSSYRTTIYGINIVVYGYLGDAVNEDLITKKLRNDSKGRSLKLKHFEDWSDRLAKIIAQINRTINDNRSEVLHCFHDPVKWATQVSINSERMINKREGDTFSEKFKNSNTDIKAIYKCSQLLVKSVEMVEVYFNPESASFGDTFKTNVYKIFDMVQAIIFHAEGKRYNKKFRLTGKSFRTVHMYESFHIIALSLIQNSIKYSKTSEIDIIIDDVDQGVSVNVVSFGPLISDNELPRLFDKGFRGRHAKAMNIDGMGIGLYIAQEIAKVHSFTIKVQSISCNYDVDRIPIAKNTFSFIVPSEGVLL